METKLRLVGGEKEKGNDYSNCNILRLEERFYVGLDGNVLTFADLRYPETFEKAKRDVSDAYLLSKLNTPVEKDREGYDLPIYVLDIQKKLDKYRVAG